jgi:transposase
VTPRTFPPAPAWSPGGHRIKAPLIYSRGSDKAWVYGALRVRDGQVRTQTAPARNTAGYLALLGALERDNPDGDLYLITDNLSSHTSGPIREWLAAHPRVQQVFIPVGAAWLNLIEAWWRLLRRLRRSVFRRSRRDRPRHARGDCPTQSPRPSRGLGSSTATTPPAAPLLHLPSLRNDALNTS